METILVTGGSTGLGLETAVHLAGNGYRVFAAVRNSAGREAVLDPAERRRVTLDVVTMDITDPASVRDAVAEVVTCGRGLYGLVNNAGIGLRGCFEDLTDEEIRRVYDVNVFGTFKP